MSSWPDSGYPLFVEILHEGRLEKNDWGLLPSLLNQSAWPEGNSHSGHWVCHVSCLLEFLKFLDSVILSPPNIFRTCSELFLHQLIGFPTSALLTLNFCAALRALQAGKWPRGRGKLWAGVWAHSVAVNDPCCGSNREDGDSLHTGASRETLHPRLCLWADFPPPASLARDGLRIFREPMSHPRVRGQFLYFSQSERPCRSRCQPPCPSPHCLPAAKPEKPGEHGALVTEAVKGFLVNRQSKSCGRGSWGTLTQGWACAGVSRLLST